MAIKKALLDGKTVYCDEERENLRGKICTCIYCGAKVFSRLWPKEKDKYTFVCLKGEQHTGTCKRYEDEKDIPTFGKITPRELIELICKLAKNVSNNKKSKDTSKKTSFLNKF